MPRRRRASTADDDRRRRRDESSDSDGYFQAPLVVKPMASPLRESAAPYRSPDTKEYKHAAKHAPHSSSESSSSESAAETGDESGSPSGSNSETSSNSEDNAESSGSSSDNDTKTLKTERGGEKPPNGKSNVTRNSPKDLKKRKSSRSRSESPNFKRLKESSKRSPSPGQGSKLSPAQRKPASPTRRSPRRERRNSPKRDSDRRRSVERRRSPRRNMSPRRRSPRRDSHALRRDSPRSRRSYSTNQRNKSERRDRRSSPRSDSKRENDSRRESDSRRENNSRRENDSRRDRVRVKSEKISPERPKIKQEPRSPEISKWDDDQDRKSENRRTRGSERPRNKRDRLDEMKRRGREMDEAERKHQWGKPEIKQEDEASSEEKQKPDLGLSGKLAEDTNVYNGVVVKYSEPSEAKKPKRRWRLYVFKGEDVLPFIPLHRQSAYLLGRDRRVADIPVDHPSCSKQHAVLQYRSVTYEKTDGSKGRRVRPYVLDLESANGTFVNNKRIDGRRYVELFERDVIKFGFSSREYVLIPEDAGDISVDVEAPHVDNGSVGQVSSL